MAQLDEDHVLLREEQGCLEILNFKKFEMVAYKDFTEFTHCIYDLKTTHNPNEWAVCCANGLYFLNI